MNILMLLMDGKSGMFQYATLLSNALADTDNVAAITPLDSETSFFSDKVDLIPFPVGDTKANFLLNTINIFNLMKFLRTVKSLSPDVIHLHNPYVIWPCILFPFLKKYKIVISLPDGQMLPGQKRIDRYLARKIHIRNSDGIIVLSEHDKKLVNVEYPDKKCYVVPHGANPIYLEYGGHEEILASDLLFFGGLQEYKGLEYLLMAVPLIIERLPSVKIAICANGDMSKYSQYLPDAGPENLVIVNKFIPHEEVSPIFRGTKVVVSPYIEQIHSGVIPLAYAFGKPVVATTNLKEQVVDGQTGIIIPEKDEKALAETLVSLLDDPDTCSRMGAAARKYADTELGWENIAGKTKDCYIDLIDK